MARESTQHKLDRVRSPRVHITYDVEVGGAIELKELPLSWAFWAISPANPTEPLPRLKDRKFVEVNPDNFDTVLEGMKPHLAFSVENKLSEEPDAANLKVDLNFKSMDDFEPENVARQVKPLQGTAGTADTAVRSARQPAGQRQTRRIAAGSRRQHGQDGEAEGRDGKKEEIQWLTRKSAQRTARAGEQVVEKSLLDQIVDEGRFGAEPAARERGKNLVKEFVSQVLEGSMTIARDAESDDQRPHRADRPPGIDSVQRSPAPPRVPEAGRHAGAA